MTNPTDLPDLPDLPDDVDLLVQPAVVSDEPAAAGATDPAGTSSSGQQRPLRELDKAPRHLRLAATIVIAGSLIPFMGHRGGWVTLVAAKLVVLLGAWSMLAQVKHDWGPKLTGAAGLLAGIRLGGKKKKKEQEKPRRGARAETPAASPVSHSLAALQLLGLAIVWGVGCVALPFLDPSEGARPVIGVAEVGMLAWACLTWVHIFAYERWGHFNPLFPLMFLGILFAGVSRVVVGLTTDLGGLPGIATVIGGAVVAAGGGLAAYTIVEALRAAKREGDEKKRAAVEARKAARRSGGASARRR